MAPYCTIDQLRSYCKLLDVETSETVLLNYAIGEENDKLKPALTKQYDLSEIQTMVTDATDSGEFIQVLSAKLGALAAARAEFTDAKRNQLKSVFEAMEADANDTLKRLRIGAIRL